MPDNILKATIQVDAPGVQKTFDNVGKSVAGAEKALKTIPNASNQATQSMVNLGRIVQDAPFGFIGIANNLNPMLESFQRLKATTGSTGGALKALGASLMGAGGLGFAVSLASSALVLFGDRLFKSGKQAKEAEEEAKKYKETIEGIFTATAKEAANTSGLVAVLQSETETRQRKLAAIKELQRIQPEIFKNLKLEGQAVTGLDAAYKDYLDNLRTVIAAKIKQQQLEQLITKLLQLQGATLTASEKKSVDALKEWNKQNVERLKGLGLTQSQILDLNKPLRDQADTNEEIATTQANIAKLMEEIAELSKGIRVPENAQKGVKELRWEFDYLRAIFDKLVLIQAEFSAGLDKLSQKRFDIASNIRLDTLATNFKKPAEKISSDLQKVVDRTTKNNPILIRSHAFKLELDANAQALEKKLATINDIFRQMLANSLTAFAVGLGEALAGGDIKNAFAGFAQAIAGGVQTMGEKLIELGTVALLANKALDKLFSNPLLTIAAGIALTAVGAALRSAFTGGVSGARAGGGPVIGGQAYVVGERGREVFVPNVGGQIIPNNQLGNFGGIRGGVMVAVAGEFRVRGNDLVAAVAKTNQSQRRLV